MEIGGIAVVQIEKGKGRRRKEMRKKNLGREREVRQ
jgi:hypothetical protein